MKKITIILLLTLLFMGFGGDLAAQCAMCKGAVQSTLTNGRSNYVSALNFGIAYLFVFPYAIVGIIGFMWYRNSKKAMAERIAVRARVRRALE